jgi:hypothetical protein
VSLRERSLVALVRSHRRRARTLTLLVPALHWEGLLSFPLLSALVFALGALSGPYPVLDTVGAHPVVVGFAAAQTVAMAMISMIGLRVRAASAEPGTP